MKIFLIEDDEYLGRVYEKAFRFAEYEVELIRDGNAALQKLSAENPLPAAIIMDIIIPEINGFDLLVMLRKEVRYVSIPIIMLTNSFSEHDTERYLAAGADLYLVKIEQQTKDVVNKVRELIHTGRAVAAH